MSISKLPSLKMIRRMDVQVSIFTAIIVTLSCLCVFAVHYINTYHDMIRSLENRVLSIYDFLEDSLDKEAFLKLRTTNDMNTQIYEKERASFYRIRKATGVRYLYTATQLGEGKFIYLVDGLPLDSEDFRYPGDPIEPEIIPELERAMAGQTVMPSKIKSTEWGKIFIAYLPIHDTIIGNVVGVVGIEFEAGSQFNTYRNLLICTPLIIVAACSVSVLFALSFFRRISNPTYRDMSNTDQLTQLKNRNAYDIDMQNLFVQRNTSGTGVLLLDLNNLKLVNDMLGHSQGDIYLKIVANVLLKTTQNIGIPYRIGGDEFIILVSNTSKKQMAALEEQIEYNFSANKPDWPVDTSLSIGWSISSAGEDSKTAYKQADYMMYKKKRAYHVMKEHDRRRDKYYDSE